MSNFDDLLNNNPAEGQSGQLSKEDYAAKMQAEREDLFTLSDNSAMEVTGDGDMFRQHLDVQSTFSRYSAVNALLIMAQNPEATRVAAFDYWKERGGYIKKGETGISILEPHEYTKEDGSPGTGYNVKKVFDISQVDTRKMKAPAPTPNYTERQLLQALVSKYPMKITGVDELDDNLGAMTDVDGSILVRKGMGFSDTFRSIAYEMASAELATDPELSPEQEFNAYPTGLTQNVEYLLDSITARTMLSNSEFIVMHNQAASDRIELAKLLNISEEQLDFVTNAEAGSGLMRIGNAIVPVQNRFPKGALYNLMTTKLGE